MLLNVLIKQMVLNVSIGGGGTVPEVFAIYQNDLESSFFFNFFDVNPVTKAQTPSDLSLVGLTVLFKTAPLNGGPDRINAVLTPVNAGQGQFRYDWQPNDTMVVDNFLAQLQIIKPGTPVRPQTVRQFELHVLGVVP